MYNILSLFFFFFKQKTAYEMRISDWSSDVCSSDLETEAQRRLRREGRNQRVLAQPPLKDRDQPARQRQDHQPQQHRPFVIAPRPRDLEDHRLQAVAVARDEFRSEERRVG